MPGLIYTCGRARLPGRHARRPLQYHHGQIEVQQEANSSDLADHMAHWVGPAGEFAERADLLVFAQQADGGQLQFTAVSGPPPLVKVSGSSKLRLGASGLDMPPGRIGGLAINLGERRRVRLNGDLRSTPRGHVLEIEEAFTLCRKYLAPSVGTSDMPVAGPRERSEIGVDDPWLADVVGRAETTCLASVTPDGAPDVAHRGGPPGFLELDSATRRLSWPEYLGDGVFKSAGNVRATSTVTLLALDLETGDAAELIGHGSYTNLRLMRGPRREPLLRDRFDFPTQGRMEVALEKAARLTGLTAPRKRLETTPRITSQSRVDDQAPQ
jgi:hypothetical protein